MEARILRGASGQLAQFAKQIKKGQLLVVRIHNDEMQDDGQEYFLAEAAEPPYQLDRDEVHNGNAFRAGYYVVKIRWLEFQARRVDHAGTRRYKRSSAVITHDLNAVVRNLTLDKLKWSNTNGWGAKRIHNMSYDTHCKIMRYASLSS